MEVLSGALGGKDVGIAGTVLYDNGVEIGQYDDFIDDYTHARFKRDACAGAFDAFLTDSDGALVMTA